jgi:hypothetical protein
MQPIKDKSLYYFILDKNGNDSDFNIGSGFYEKKSLMESLKKSDKHAILEFFRPPENHLSMEGPKINQNLIDSQRFQVPIKVEYIEKVINLRGYQNSVEFTIGSSMRMQESEKYLVGINIEMESLDKQINRIKEGRAWYKLSFDDFDRVGRFMPVRRYIDWMSADRYEFPFSESVIDTKFLGHAGNYKDVKHFSYDDHFKYYTIIG